MGYCKLPTTSFTRAHLLLAHTAMAPNMTLPHVLLLVFDDMRPWFKPFSDSGIDAPNLASLAASSTSFHNTFVQQAVCGPSRNSFMSGRRPSSTRTWNFKTSFRKSGIDTQGVPGSAWRTLPQSFKEAGYLTLGMGKLFHPGSPASNDCPTPHPASGEPDCPSWSTSFETASPANVTLDKKPVLRCGGVGGNGMAQCKFDYVNPDAQIFTVRQATLSNGTVVEASPACADLSDEKCTDEWLAESAVKTLRTAAAACAPPAHQTCFVSSLALLVTVAPHRRRTTPLHSPRWQLAALFLRGRLPQAAPLLAAAAALPGQVPRPAATKARGAHRA